MPDWPMDRWQMWLGPGKHFLVFPLRAGKLINYVGFVPADEEMQESWSAPGDPDALRAEFIVEVVHQRVSEERVTLIEHGPTGGDEG
jgi:salicylate hydroxylase